MHIHNKCMRACVLKKADITSVGICITLSEFGSLVTMPCRSFV